LTGSVHADILNVPAEFPTIQAAMDAAEDGDEIVLAPGRYDIATTLIEPAAPISIVIRSTDPTDAAIRDSTVLVRPSDQPAFVLAITPSFTLRGLTLESTAEDARFLVGTYLGIGLFEVEIDRCSTAGVRASDDAPFDVELDGVTNDPTIELRVLECAFTEAWSGLLNRDGSAMVWDTVVDDTTRGVITQGGGMDARRCTFRSVRRDGVLGGSAASTIEDCEFVENSAAVWTGFTSLTLSGVTVQGGLFGFDASEIVAEDSTFSDLTSGSALQGNRITARRCTFADNTNLFGAVHCLSGTLLVEDCDFINNRGRFASAIESHLNSFDEPAIIRRSRFIGNGVDENYTDAFTSTIKFLTRTTSRADIIVEDCEFRANTAVDGGAFDYDGRRHRAAFTIRRTRFVQNTAELGAVYATSRTLEPFVDLGDGVLGGVRFEGCEFVANAADRYAIGYGAASFIGCTFAGNTASTEGSLGVGELTLDSSVLVRPGTDVPLLGDDIVFNNDVFVSTLTAASSILPDDSFGPDTITLDPLFIRNPSDGGDGWGDDPSTPDTDESLNDDFGDLRLRPGSPAIDAGTNGLFMPGDTDLDGNPRLADDPGIPGSCVDIGAYEFQGATCLADVNGDGLANPSDFNAWVIAFNAGSPLADQNRDGVVNPADFKAWAMNLGSGCP
ncbi:MAG: right-handed parallel beta-helix repeat-containing protein, partial [Planctomycetota bacterium]